MDDLERVWGEKRGELVEESVVWGSWVLDVSLLDLFVL